MRPRLRGVEWKARQPRREGGDAALAPAQRASTATHRTSRPPRPRPPQPACGARAWQPRCRAPGQEVSRTSQGGVLRVCRQTGGRALRARLGAASSWSLSLSSSPLRGGGTGVRQATGDTEARSSRPHLRSARSAGAGAPRARPLRRSSTMGASGSATRRFLRRPKTARRVWRPVGRPMSARKQLVPSPLDRPLRTTRTEVCG